MLNITQEQLQQLLESMNVGLILLDEDFQVARLNAEAVRIDGRPAAELVGRSCWEAWPGVEGTELATIVVESMAGRTTRTLGHHCVGPNGREAWLEMRIHPFGDGLGVYFRDATEKKLAEKALEATQERYRLAARATNDIIWDFDIAANDISWNDAAEEFLGAAPAPRNTPIEWWAEAVHPEDRERVTASLKRALADGSAYWSEEYRLRRVEGGYATVYDRGFIIRGAAGEAQRAVGAIVDLTQIRATEQKVQQLQSELIHVSRLSAMGTMASTLAHELNQPLTAVSSYVAGCQRLMETGDDAERMRGGLKGAKDSALRAGDVIRRLRAMIERGEVRRSRVNLREAVEEAIALALVGSDDAALRTRIQIDPTLTVEADQIQLQQVILNLGRNAIQAMEGQPRKRLTVRASNDAGEVAIEICDTGSGIPEEFRRSLFEPFVSTRETGMGIGLSISRTIVEAHRGRIWAEDNEGGGTVFRITLPLDTDEAANGAFARADAPAA